MAYSAKKSIEKHLKSIEYCVIAGNRRELATPRAQKTLVFRRRTTSDLVDEKIMNDLLL